MSIKSLVSKYVKLVKDKPKTERTYELRWFGKTLYFIGVLGLDERGEPAYIRTMNPFSWVYLVLAIIWYPFMCMFTEDRVQDMCINKDCFKLW